MQPLARTSIASSDRGGGGTPYTAAQVQALLLAPAVQEDWAFDRLDKTGTRVGGPLGDLTPFVNMQGGAAVTHDSTRAIKRDLRFLVRADSGLNIYSDLVRPHYRIRAADGGWLDWTLGVFTSSKVPRQVTVPATYQQWQGSDILRLLNVAAFQQSYGVAAGVPRMEAIAAIVNSYGGAFAIPINILPAPMDPLPGSLMWEAGKTPLAAITDLLAGANYLSPWADENGVLNSAPVPDYTGITPAFTFDAATRQSTNVLQPITDDIDLDKAYNQVTVLVEPSNTGVPPYGVTYTNNNPASPVSTVSLGYVKPAPIIRDARIKDPGTAYTVARSKAQEYARVYETIVIETTAWALSQDRDFYAVQWATPTEGMVVNNVVETKWTHEIKVGGKTRHELTRVTPA